jgi:hypothetical protein
MSDKDRQIEVLRRQVRDLGGVPNAKPTLPPPGVDCTHGPNRNEDDDA